MAYVPDYGTMGSTAYVVIAATIAKTVRIKEEKPTPPVVPPPYTPLAARNDRCPCGSGNKYKRCCRPKQLSRHER
jgi:uncharacterized protein YecA (UPF0149 family)